MSDESDSVSSTRGVTPDDLLHTGATDNPSPEDLVLASGKDLTPANLEWAERTLAREGRAAMDKRLP
ncbi:MULTISPECIES: hypothetical protein [unclassified Streptomyces]|uniref:hypothetical protein n=1 Tax=unclassified Streptomyces TaxID=2593676 RepID=UPI002E2CACFF|nr:hypothetical protein [Streptomyces sp. NBC_01423]WSX89346.1 hypothetical protein OH827_01765 [Streptomyces sp. NBC_00891]WSY03825.1 hypothetical protein OG464_01765 [Streptomyces sp. NBC_00890]WSZ05451.1 hypothetical protein OG704_01765 [Streptomyces sp. NBC_00869]WSZ27053.1 hypothetical protein OG498_31800 [Streptomyces sp. NBC_00870]